MTTLFFLTTRKAKNKFLELLRKPLKLIVTVGFIFLIVMNFSLSQNSPVGARPLYEFRAIIFAFYLLCFITETQKGFQSGGTMFSMADVNMLFMSPLKSVAILFHGMLSRLGSSIFMGLAFVYQFALIRTYYPITVKDMLISVAGYAAVVFVSQLAGMLIYFFTCGQQERIKIAKACLYSMFVIFTAVSIIRFIGSDNFTVSSLARVVTSFPMRLFPVVGWAFTAVEGFMQADGLKILAGVILCLAFTAITFILIAFSKQGYYEDVLLSAEKNTDTKADDGASSNVKIKKTVGGLNKGRGASVLFYKHMLENRRTKSAVFSPTSIFYLVMIGVYGFVFDGDFVILFSLSCMVSFLPVLSGRWLKELTMPHVYLIPESPIKKLFFILPEMLPKILTESVLQCALIGYICSLSYVIVFFLIFARASVSFVLIGSSLVMARIFREREKNNLFISMSVFPGMILVLPSVLLCVAALNFGMGIVFAFSLMAAVNMLIFLVLLFLARNLLRITE